MAVSFSKGNDVASKSKKSTLLLSQSRKFDLNTVNCSPSTHGRYLSTILFSGIQNSYDSVSHALGRAPDVWGLEFAGKAFQAGKRVTSNFSPGVVVAQ